MIWRLTLAVALLAAVSYAQQETVTYTFNGGPVFIGTDDADLITIASIMVPRALTIGTVTARVQIEYPNSGDLKVYLYSPAGIRTRLTDNNCSVAGIDTTFDDAAPSMWSSVCPTALGQGPFRGNEPLANFRQDPSSIGIWRLAVENDESDSRYGWLTGFSLTITGTRQAGPTFIAETTVNAASRVATSIAPGELISLYGFALGPASAVTAPAGSLPTTLGGVTVRFDGTAVPIAYASLYRLDVQVPFGLTPGGQTSIQVTNGTATSRTIQIPIAPSAPGIFTVQSDGLGQAKAVNQDGSLNGATRPAPKGSIVTIYASGLGAVAPAVPAGMVPPTGTVSPTVASVAASLGATPARVLFAGLAPGWPGYYQLNIEVPADARSGPQQLVISTNNIASQSGVLIQVQ
jgi:uncharacterized protein (TIGR03437 family)